jgi:hypothetical protein
LTDKDHFIEFCKHSGMVNTKTVYQLTQHNIAEDLDVY